MKKLCLVLVCFTIGVGGWMALDGRTFAGSSLGAGSHPSEYGGGSPQPRPRESSDQPDQTMDVEEAAVVLGTLIGMLVVAGEVAARRDCVASVDAKSPHGNQASPAHQRAVRPTC
jgi:hypothetical protein